MGQQWKVGRVATAVTQGEDGVRRVTYHATDVVTVYPNGRIDLNHGGWQTPTTKTRMNQASNQFKLGFQVWQENWHWYVSIDGCVIGWPSRTPRLTVRIGHDLDRELGNPPPIIIGE